MKVDRRSSRWPASVQIAPAVRVLQRLDFKLDLPRIYGDCRFHRRQLVLRHSGDNAVNNPKLYLDLRLLHVSLVDGAFDAVTSETE